MAERIQVELVDDIDGSEAQQTVTFALDGVAYEIDLSEQHARQLRSVFARYVERARTPEPTPRTTRQQEREQRRERQTNRQLTDQIRGAAQRSRERLNKAQNDVEDQRQEDEQPQEPALLPQEPVSEPVSETAPDEPVSDSRVPAVSLPHFSAAE